MGGNGSKEQQEYARAEAKMNHMALGGSLLSPWKMTADQREWIIRNLMKGSTGKVILEWSRWNSREKKV